MPSSVSHITLVDTQRPPKVRGLPDNLPIHIIDHHPLGREIEPNQTYSGEAVGAATTLLVEKIQATTIPVNGLEATLMAMGIYEDTGSLSYGTTTPRDHRAAAWLLDHGAALDTVRQFLTPPLSEEQQVLFDELFRSSDSRIIEGHVVSVCAATVDHYISEISSVAHRLRDTLDSAILFVIVQMPDSLQLVCRATVDALDVGEIARLFGGGGHSRAAAAAIHDQSLDEAVKTLWDAVQNRIQPVVRVADLMSYGVQRVEASKKVKDVVGQMRHIGHEGYPVVENGAVTGLLTRRDLDRAAEHGLNEISIREIMSAGSVTLHPTDSISTLEQRMVESGWGQIPVVDENDQLIGIVTRTDLIKHWAQVHPPTAPPAQILRSDQIEAVLDKDATKLIQIVAEHAQDHQVIVYMVGGAVRDLLLYRKNLDIDFVVEDNAIQFAESLGSRYGGKVSSFRPFGTAKWILDEATLSALELDGNRLPEHIDFATARNEFYEHPTALPTVYNSSIKLDLGRRDFTINTLALQLSPINANGRILDFYGGLYDLKAGLIRVLHSLSFVDDPTRILRAIRFERRLGFKIEARTGELIETAKPMLGRITGERLRNELTLLMREKEPEHGLRNLESRGVLTAIHPAFELPDDLVTLFEAARDFEAPWAFEAVDIVDLYWILLLANSPNEHVKALCERLLFSIHMTETILTTRRVVTQADELTDPATKPSQIAAQLNGISDLALVAGWLSVRKASAREVLRRYQAEWQHQQPLTNGNTLQAMGLKPGPCFSVILSRLRSAWLDNEITNEAEEKHLLDSLIREGICDDRA